MTITPIRAPRTVGRITYRDPEPVQPHVVTVRRCTLDCCAHADMPPPDETCLYCGRAQDDDHPDRSIEHIAHDLAAVHREATEHTCLTGTVNADRADDIYDLLCELTDATAGAALAGSTSQP